MFLNKITKKYQINATEEWKKDLAITLFADAVATLIEYDKEDKVEIADDIWGNYLQQTDLTQSIPHVMQEYDVDIDKYLPMELVNKIIKAFDADWKGKLTVKELYDYDDQAAHRLMLGALGHGVNADDDRETEKWLKEKGIDKIKDVHFENDFNKATEAYDELKTNYGKEDITAAANHSLKYLMSSLYQLLGNKRYLKDFETILDRIVLEPKDNETIMYLVKDLNNVKQT
jgi:hypothetical protein